MELKKALKEAKTNKRWSVATQVMSWFMTFTGIFTGIALIMTGVGAVAGALLVAGGLISLTNQIMQLTGAWRKIAEALPGDDHEKKAATIMWMQIGITVLAFLLSGAGVVFGGGPSAVKGAMALSQMATGGVMLMGVGTTQIGEGITSYLHKSRLAEIRKHMRKLAILKHQREDLQHKVEESVSRIEQLFQDLARTLDFELELFRADQRVNR